MRRPSSDRMLSTSNKLVEGEAGGGSDENKRKKQRASSSRTLQEKAESLLRIADIVTKTNQERREILDGLPYQDIDAMENEDEGDETESEVESCHVISGENEIQVISNYPPLMVRPTKSSSSTVSSVDSTSNGKNNSNQLAMHRSLTSFVEPLKDGTANSNNSSIVMLDDTPSVISKASTTRSGDSKSSKKLRTASRKELKRQLQDLHKALATMRENSDLKLRKLQLELDRCNQEVEKRDAHLRDVYGERDLLQVQKEEYEARFQVCVGTKESADAFLDMERRNRQLQARVEMLLKEKEQLQSIHHQMAATMMGCSKCSRKHHQQQQGVPTNNKNSSPPTLWTSITTSLNDWDPNLTKEAEESSVTTPATTMPTLIVTTRLPTTEEKPTTSKKLVSPPRAAFRSSSSSVASLDTSTHSASSTGNSRPPLSPAKRSSSRRLYKDQTPANESPKDDANEAAGSARSFTSRRMNQEPNPSYRAIPKTDTIQDRLLLDKNGVSTSATNSSSSLVSNSSGRSSRNGQQPKIRSPKSPTSSRRSRAKSPKLTTSRSKVSLSTTTRRNKKSLPEPTPGALDSFFSNISRNVKQLNEEQMDEERSFFTRRSTRSAPAVTGRMTSNATATTASTTSSSDRRKKKNSKNPISFTDRWADLETETVASADTDSLLDTQSMFTSTRSYRSTARSKLGGGAYNNASSSRAYRLRQQQRIHRKGGVTSVHTGSLEREVAEWRGDSTFTTSLL